MNQTEIDLLGSTGTGAYSGGGVVAGTASGSAYIYGSDAGFLIVEHAAPASLIVNCTGNCVVNQVPSPAFPANSIPVAVATISDGQWTAATIPAAS